MPQNFDLIETAFNVMKFFVPFLFALCFHEFAHGWVARLRGDRTAEIMGRLTLNPMAHADLIGTIILPIMAVITHIPLFGWAKPVPVDERNLKNPKTDMFWVAFAGPASNMLLAVVGAAAFAGVLIFMRGDLEMQQPGAMTIAEVTIMFIKVNVFLAVFNMIPLHPLDGGKVLARFLPYSLNRKLEDAQQYTSMALLILFVTGGFWLISAPAIWVSTFLIATAERMAS